MYMFFLWWEYPLPLSQRICLCLVRFLDGLDFPAGENTAVDSVDMTSWQHKSQWFQQRFDMFKLKNLGRRFRCYSDQGQHGRVWNPFFGCKVGKYMHMWSMVWTFLLVFPTFVGLWIQYVVPICPNGTQKRGKNGMLGLIIALRSTKNLLKHVPQQKSQNHHSPIHHSFKQVPGCFDVRTVGFQQVHNSLTNLPAFASNRGGNSFTFTPPQDEGRLGITMWSVVVIETLWALYFQNFLDKKNYYDCWWSLSFQRKRELTYRTFGKEKWGDILAP